MSWSTQDQAMIGTQIEQILRELVAEKGFQYPLSCHMVAENGAHFVCGLRDGDAHPTVYYRSHPMEEFCLPASLTVTDGVLQRAAYDFPAAPGEAEPTPAALQALLERLKSPFGSGD